MLLPVRDSTNIQLACELCPGTCQNIPGYQPHSSSYTAFWVKLCDVWALKTDFRVHAILLTYRVPEQSITSGRFRFDVIPLFEQLGRQRLNLVYNSYKLSSSCEIWLILNGQSVRTFLSDSPALTLTDWLAQLILHSKYEGDSVITETDWCRKKKTVYFYKMRLQLLLNIILTNVNTLVPTVRQVSSDLMAKKSCLVGAAFPPNSLTSSLSLNRTNPREPSPDSSEDENLPTVTWVSWAEWDPTMFSSSV